MLLLTTAADGHAVAVGRELLAHGAQVVTCNLETVGDGALSVEPGRFIDVAGVRVDDGWSVWFRRIGAVPHPPGMDPLEARLRGEELEALLFGGLAAVSPRWVDRPDVVERAEFKLLQLAVARAAGVAVPPTMATSDVARARDFLAAGPAVAKATSSGVGLAPYVERVTDSDLDRLQACPTLLQRAIDTRADFRVVVVGVRAWVWRRGRVAEQPLDWRAVDPSGVSFVLIDEPELAGAAISVASALGLLMSVQDWVSDGEQVWFLEANPVGQWMFLQGARELVAPAVAQLLLRGHG